MRPRLRRSVLGRALAVLTGIGVLVGLPGVAPAAPATAAILGADSGSAIPDRYTVVLNDGAAAVRDRVRALADQYGGRVDAVYEHALHGFSARMSATAAARLAADPSVDYVEQDQVIKLADTQENPPSWGLDRIDQPALPLDKTFTFDVALAPVNIYVIDTGIRISHSEFGSRAVHGWDFFDNDPVADDCNGHGTHVAATAAGNTFGVARNAKMTALRVFNCIGVSGSASIQQAVEWVTAHAVKPAVVNISIANDCKDGSGNPAPCPVGTGMAIDQAITASINEGISYVIAAGNNNINACGNPIGRVPGALTVGASTDSDTRASFSNWGSCVDLFAPGEHITSAGILSDTDTRVLNGTSMAAPHVTGAIARLLSRSEWANAQPAAVKSEVLSHLVTTGVLTGLDAGSPNRLLYLPPPPKAGGSAIAAVRNADGRLGLFGVSSTNQLLYRTQTTAGGNDWSPWSTSTTPGWYALAAQAAGDGKIGLFGLRKAGRDVWRRTQAATNTNSWTQWHQLDGLLNSLSVAANTNGTMEVYGTNDQGDVWHRSQQSPNPDDYGAWVLFTPGLGAPARGVAAERNSNGMVEVFALRNDGQIWHRWQATAGAQAYTSWVQLDGLLTSIAVARGNDGALELFGVNAAGQFFHRGAVSGTNNWLSWSELDVPAAVGKLRSLTAEANTDGRIEAFAVNATGQLWHRAQTAPGSSTYTIWTQLNGELRP